MQWRTVGDENIAQYGFDYDNLDRITAGDYKEKVLMMQGSGQPDREDWYDVLFSYADHRGNIASIDRWAPNTTQTARIKIDQLTMSYAGDSLTSVTEASDQTNWLQRCFN